MTHGTNHHENFIKLCFYRSLSHIPRLNVGIYDLHCHHGLTLELQGNVDDAAYYYKLGSADSLDAEFHYGRCSTQNESDIPNEISMALMQRAAFNGSRCGQLYLGTQLLTIDSVMAEYWLEKAAQVFPEANIPYASALIRNHKLVPAKQVLMAHTREDPNAVLDFIQSLRSSLPMSQPNNNNLFMFTNWVKPELSTDDSVTIHNNNNSRLLVT